MNESHSLISFYEGVFAWFKASTVGGGEVALDSLLDRLKAYEMPRNQYFNHTKSLVSDQILNDCLIWSARRCDCFISSSEDGITFRGRRLREKK